MKQEVFFPSRLADEPEPTLDAWLVQAVAEIAAIAGATGTALWLWDPMEQALAIRAHHNLGADYVAYGNQSARLAVAKEKAPVYLSYRAGTSIEFANPKAEADFKYFTPGFDHLPIRFVYTAPIALINRRLGAVALYFPDVVELDEVVRLRTKLATTQIAAMLIQEGMRGELHGRLNELSEANDNLARMLHEMKQLDRLKSLFISAVSHELRTPLTSIIGYAEFLEDEVGGPLTAEQAGFVGEIQEGSTRLLHIVDDLLDFARLEAGTFELTPQDADLVELTSRTVASLAPQLRVGDLTLVAELPEEPVVLRMDPRRIGQVLLNLLGNAIKFTPAGGRVTVRLTTEPGAVRVEVTDTGIGIAPEHQARLFDKFYQVDPSLTRVYQGVGLGLAISKSLIASHGGEIGVASRIGEGATFWFRLPVEPC